MKSLPKKAPAKGSKPVARRRPAVQPIRKKPTAKKPVVSKRPATRIGELGRESYSGMPDIPESVQKRIQEMIASGRIKAPTNQRKTTPRKTIAKKAAPKSVIKSAISRGGKTGDKIIAGLASSRRGKTVKGNPFLMGKSKAAPKKTAAKKKPQTTTRSFGGTGFAMPESARKRGEAIRNSPLYSEVQGAQSALNKYWKEKHGYSQKSADADPVYRKMRDDLFALQDRAAGTSSSQTPAPQTPAPQPPAPPPTQQQTGGGSFESAYIDWMESKPEPFTMRRPKKMASKKYRAAKEAHDKSVAAWQASKPSRATYSAPVTTAPTAPTEPVVQPDYVPPPAGEAPDKFAGRYVPQRSILGTPDMSISSNIVGQSFDPNFAASFRPPPQPPGSTFGGYGQQAPMQALAPYAGMAQNNPQPTDFFPTYIPKPEPIYETVQRPEPNRPAPRPNAEPVMGRGPGNNPGSSMINYDVFERPYSRR